MKAIIIAGGLGTRLRPITYNTPKSMVPVANVPFIIHQINLIKKYGIRDIILNLHYLSSRIRRVLEESAPRGVRLYYSVEEMPLGTAGAVKNAEEYFEGETLLIFNGDILTDMNLEDLIEYHRRKKAKATLTLTKVEDPTTYGLVITAPTGVIQEFIEKPSWERVTANTINAGIYVIEPNVFREVPFGVEYSFERELFPKLLREGKPMFGYPSEAYWIDIGSPAKYIQAHRSILQGEVEVAIPGREIKKNVWVSTGAKVDKSARIFAPAIIGRDVKIKKGARVNGFATIGERVTVSECASIENSVILGGTFIGKDASLNDCIIGFNCRIEEGAVIGGGVVLADGTVVRKGSRLGTNL